jgi:hypothetical protein
MNSFHLYARHPQPLSKSKEEFKERYIDILHNHQYALSIDKYNLGLAKNFKHKIHLKTQDPVHQKQS